MRINPHHKKDFLSVNPNLNTSTSLKLNESKIPILFMVGNEDTLVNPETIKIASDLIVNSQFIGLDGVGHSVYYEKPDLYNKLVMGFLKKHQLEHQTLH
jgi:pimeloyl-ACP methyl ester carboxylesterase